MLIQEKNRWVAISVFQPDLFIRRPVYISAKKMHNSAENLHI
jgi:hypothetical protein